MMSISDEPFFFAQPNDIFDALYSSEKKYSLKQLKYYALGRGIVVSNKCDRETLCRRLASLTFDYHSFMELSEAMQSVSRKKQSSVIHINEKISLEEVQAAFPELQQSRHREELNLKSKQGNIEIIANYTEIDHSQTRLKQRTPKDSKIEILDGKIRYTSNPRTEEIVHNLIKTLETSKKVEIGLEKIDLSTIEDSRLINDFFLKLTLSDNKKIPFMQVAHLSIHKTDSDQEDKDKSAMILGSINNASMTGNDILNSPEVKKFLKSGEYYIHTIRWVTDLVSIVDTKGEKHNIHLKIGAQASPADTRETFKFEPMRYHMNISGQMAVNDQLLDSNNEQKFLDTLETSAFEIFNAIKNPK